MAGESVPPAGCNVQWTESTMKRLLKIMKAHKRYRYVLFPSLGLPRRREVQKWAVLRDLLIQLLAEDKFNSSWLRDAKKRGLVVHSQERGWDSTDEWTSETNNPLRHKLERLRSNYNRHKVEFGKWKSLDEMPEEKREQLQSLSPWHFKIKKLEKKYFRAAAEFTRTFPSPLLSRSPSPLRPTRLSASPSSPRYRTVELHVPDAFPSLTGLENEMNDFEDARGDTDYSEDDQATDTDHRSKALRSSSTPGDQSSMARALQLRLPSIVDPNMEEDSNNSSSNGESNNNRGIALAKGDEDSGAENVGGQRADCQAYGEDEGQESESDIEEQAERRDENNDDDDYEVIGVKIAHEHKISVEDRPTGPNSAESEIVEARSPQEKHSTLLSVLCTPEPEEKTAMSRSSTPPHPRPRWKISTSPAKPSNTPAGTDSTADYRTVRVAGGWNRRRNKYDEQGHDGGVGETAQVTESDTLHNVDGRITSPTEDDCEEVDELEDDEETEEEIEEIEGIEDMKDYGGDVDNRVDVDQEKGTVAPIDEEEMVSHRSIDMMSSTHGDFRGENKILPLPQLSLASSPQSEPRCDDPTFESIATGPSISTSHRRFSDLISPSPSPIMFDAKDLWDEIDPALRDPFALPSGLGDTPLIVLPSHGVDHAMSGVDEVARVGLNLSYATWFNEVDTAQAIRPGSCDDTAMTSATGGDEISNDCVVTTEYNDKRRTRRKRKKQRVRFAAETSAVVEARPSAEYRKKNDKEDNRPQSSDAMSMVDLLKNHRICVAANAGRVQVTEMIKVACGSSKSRARQRVTDVEALERVPNEFKRIIVIDNEDMNAVDVEHGIHRMTVPQFTRYLESLRRSSSTTLSTTVTNTVSRDNESGRAPSDGNLVTSRTVQRKKRKMSAGRSEKIRATPDSDRPTGEPGALFSRVDPLMKNSIAKDLRRARITRLADLDSSDLNLEQQLQIDLQRPHWQVQVEEAFRKLRMEWFHKAYQVLYGASQSQSVVLSNYQVLKGSSQTPKCFTEPISLFQGTPPRRIVILDRKTDENALHLVALKRFNPVLMTEMEFLMRFDTKHVKAGLVE
ncbi:hypothetical protein IAR55_006971 [Kwoniella newhampshirensis]|uniref:Myb/SANT-like domain-containing protein n=1 Tax=Kwoniella newhampshirensis TaxID=1651941 RepID=A0AAW0YSR9_9TREE